MARCCIGLSLLFVLHLSISSNATWMRVRVQQTYQTINKSSFETLSKCFARIKEHRKGAITIVHVANDTCTLGEQQPGLSIDMNTPLTVEEAQNVSHGVMYAWTDSDTAICAYTTETESTSSPPYVSPHPNCTDIVWNGTLCVQQGQSIAECQIGCPDDYDLASIKNKTELDNLNRDLEEWLRNSNGSQAGRWIVIGLKTVISPSGDASTRWEDGTSITPKQEEFLRGIEQLLASWDASNAHTYGKEMEHYATISLGDFQWRYVSEGRLVGGCLCRKNDSASKSKNSIADQ